MDTLLGFAICLEAQMYDLLYLGLTLLFFALTYGFIVVCEKLMEDKV